MDSTEPRNDGPSQARSDANPAVSLALDLDRDYGNRLRWVQDEGVWWVYDKHEGRWSREDRDGARLMTRAVAGHTTTPAVIEAALREAKGLLAARPRDFDTDPALLCCRNGVLDTRTGRVEPHDPDLLMTKTTGVDFNSAHPGIARWEKIVLALCQGDEELAAFIRRAAGASLAGDQSEKAFLQVQGPTNSGKSTLSAGLSAALGEYHVEIDTSLVAKGSGEEATSRYALADLPGARLVTISELAKGARFKPLMKQITGSDVVAARMPGQRAFNFKPQCTVWLFTNFVPRGGGDAAMYSRLLAVKFGRSIPKDEMDPGVIRWASSPEGGAAVLAWAARGCVEWRCDGLNPPASVQLETLDQAEDDDTFGTFIREELELTPNWEKLNQPKSSWVVSKDVLARYRTWCEDNNEARSMMTGAAFGIAMRERGHPAVQSGGPRYYQGVQLVPRESRFPAV